MEDHSALSSLQRVGFWLRYLLVRCDFWRITPMRGIDHISIGSIPQLTLVRGFVFTKEVSLRTLVDGSWH